MIKNNKEKIIIGGLLGLLLVCYNKKKQKNQKKS
jgi:hypothetical protein